MSTPEPLPDWLHAAWQPLWAAHSARRLGHAWLICGAEGVGKRLFAKTFAQALLCQTPHPSGEPCGLCAECQLMASGNHPDRVLIAPDAESASKEIKVDTIRELVAGESLMPSRGAIKILIIAPAEAMNRAAANSLLKTLEEPSSSTLLLLVSEQPSRLPATILSRCQRIVIAVPSAAVAVPWLQTRLPNTASPELLLHLAAGAPLRALELATGELLTLRETLFEELSALTKARLDPLALAATWQRRDLGLVLSVFAGWLGDLLRLQCNPQVAFLNHPDKRGVLLPLTAGLDAASVHRLLQEVFKAQRLITAPVNKTLLLEALLIRWALLSR